MPNEPLTGATDPVPEDVLKALDHVLAYISVDEERHYEENDKPENHIYRDVLKVKEWRRTQPNPPLEPPPYADRQD